jgi:biopolymer transport protein ExbD
MTRKRKQQEVELNMASMLDMAFQLLTFFVLTFRPAPVEGQISLRLPPAQAVANKNGQQVAGKVDKAAVDIKGVDTLTITLFSQTGNIDSMAVNGKQVDNLSQMAMQLDTAFKDTNNPFEQVIISSSSRLRYDQLMRVVELCTHQKILKDGKLEPLSKLSFVEMPDGGG